MNIIPLTDVYREENSMIVVIIVYAIVQSVKDGDFN